MSFSRNAAAGVLQVVATGGCLFVLYRYLAHILGPASIGLWSIVLSGATATRLADLGVSGSVVKFVAADLGAGKLEDARQAVAFALVIALVVVGVVLSVMWWIAPVVLRPILGLHGAVSEAVAIVPTVLLSAWFATGGSVMLGALDGLQRMDIRAVVVSIGAVSQVIATWTLVPSYGLQGIALGHLVQSTVTLALAGLAVRVKLGSLFFGQRPNSRQRLRAMMVYGGGLQLTALAQMVFEPLVRALLAHYGTLALTGYYEMATRLVYQARSILVGGYAALIPHVALVYSRYGREPVRQVYMSAYRLLAGLTIPFFALLISLLPLASYVWLSRFEPHLLLLGVVAGVTWAANALIVPAYYVFLGLGRLRWNTASQIVIAVMSAVLAPLLGARFGGYGVAVGCCVAVVIGSLTVIVALHREEGIPLRYICPPLNWPAIVSVIFSAAICVTAMSFGSSGITLITAVLGPVAQALVIGLLQSRAGWGFRQALADATRWRPPEVAR